MPIPAHIAEYARNLEAAGQDALRIRRRFVEDLDKARNLDPDQYAPEQRRQAEERAQTKARQELDGLRGKVDTSEELAQQWIDKQGPKSIEEQLLAETREQRAWSRARSLLEAGKSATELIGQAVQDGDHTTLSALRTELPAYAQTTDSPVVAVPPSRLREQIDQGLRQTLPDEHNQRSAAEMRARVEENVGSARQGVANAESAVGRMPEDPNAIRHAMLEFEVADANGSTAMG